MLCGQNKSSHYFRFGLRYTLVISYELTLAQHSVFLSLPFVHLMHHFCLFISLYIYKTIVPLFCYVSWPNI